jgi:hypothetical protein
LRTAEVTESTQGNIKHWLKQDEGEPGFELLAEEEVALVIFF